MTTELIQLLPLNEAIIKLMDNHGLSKLEQVGLLTIIVSDINFELEESER